MSDKIEVSRQMIANIHNAVAGLHPTGEDIIVVAAVMMDLRKMLQEAPDSGQEGDNK